MGKMRKKPTKMVVMTVLVIITIALSIKTYYDEKHRWIYYDVPPAPSKQLIVQKDLPSISPQVPSIENGFYIRMKHQHVDDGMLYEKKEKINDKGFLVKMDRNGSFKTITP
jgi:hypothetical protein